jgi:hypothetical protein
MEPSVTVRSRQPYERPRWSACGGDYDCLSSGGYRILDAERRQSSCAWNPTSFFCQPRGASFFGEAWRTTLLPFRQARAYDMNRKDMARFSHEGRAFRSPGGHPAMTASEHAEAAMPDRLMHNGSGGVARKIISGYKPTQEPSAHRTSSRRPVKDSILASGAALFGHRHRLLSRPMI